MEPREHEKHQSENTEAKSAYQKLTNYIQEADESISLPPRKLIHACCTLQ